MRRRSPTFTVQDLVQAWMLSRDSGNDAGRPGIDGTSAVSFSGELTANLSVLSRRIRSGEYSFSPLYPAFVRKKSGKLRLICVPTVADRLVQRAVRDYLEDGDRLGLYNDLSYGFLRGRGVRSALVQACKLRTVNPCAVKVDISSFFDSIDRGIILNIINKKVKSKRVRQILRGVISMEVQPTTTYARRQIAALGIKRNHGLRQGMPLSPLLSNLFLHGFDRRLGQAGISAVRYADDIVAFAPNWGAAEHIFEEVRTGLDQLGLRIPDLGVGDKASLICGPRESVEFLGADIRDIGRGTFRACIPKGKINEVEADLREIASMKECLKRRANLGSVSRSLDAIVGGLEGAFRHAHGYGDFMIRVRSARDAALSALLGEVIGPAALADLSADAKKVLGVAPY